MLLQLLCDAKKLVHPFAIVDCCAALINRKLILEINGSLAYISRIATGVVKDGMGEDVPVQTFLKQEHREIHANPKTS